MNLRRFVSNLLRYMCAKNNSNVGSFGKVIAKTTGTVFGTQCSYNHIYSRLCLFCMTKVRYILCQRLASLLKLVEKPSLSCNNVQRKDPEDILDEGFIKDTEPELARTSAMSDPMLINIRDLLEKRDRHEEEDRDRARNDAKIRREWMLAAVVVNRLCAIFFATSLVIVTLVFFCVFHTRH